VLPRLAYLTLCRSIKFLALLASGDVRHRSTKRVASAVGEGSIAVQLAYDYLGQR
jgi:thioredoxin reductase